MMQVEHFTKALLKLGATDVERAQALGVSLRSFTRYKNGRALPKAECLMPHPRLLKALVADAEMSIKNKTAPALER